MQQGGGGGEIKITHQHRMKHHLILEVMLRLVIQKEQQLWKMVKHQAQINAFHIIGRV